MKGLGPGGARTAVTERWGSACQLDKSHPAKKSQWRSVKPIVSSNTKHKLSLMDITSALIKEELNGTNIGKNFAGTNVFRLLWFQTVASQRFRKK